MHPVTVRLDEAEVGIARRWAEELLGSGIEREPNYTGISRPDRYVTGYLGELALASWLTSMRVLYRHRVALDGKSDAPEFIVWIAGRAQSLDVKTASEARYTRMMMPAAQELDAALYVSARVLGAGVVDLMGWLTTEDMDTCEVGDFGHGPTRYVDFARMRPMLDLMTALDTTRVVRRVAA